MVVCKDRWLAQRRNGLGVIEAMKEGAVLICFICKSSAGAGKTIARKENNRLCDGDGAAHNPGAIDGRAVEPVRAGGLLLGATRRHHLSRVLPKIATAAGAIGPAKGLVMWGPELPA
jgi:NAD(P) transhydrogenase subunit alpha